MIKIPLNWQNSKSLLTRFVAGSLLVVFASTSAVSLWFAVDYVKREQTRVSLSEQQILRFFQNQYTSFAEEMWTGSLESMNLRVAAVAAQLGSSHYETFISDPTGRCLFSANHDSNNGLCTTPPELLDLVKSKVSFPPKFMVKYDENRHKTIFLTPLVVGTALKGYLFAAVSDPYEFYRGDFLSLAFQKWIPALLVVLVLWSVWLLISQKYLIEPYLKGIVALERKEAIAHMAQQVGHDLKNPVATILSMTRTLKNIPKERKEILENAARSIRDIADGILKSSPVVGNNLISSNVEYSDLVPILESVVQESSEQLSENKNIQVLLNKNGFSENGQVQISSIEVKRVLQNLIMNAVEALGVGGGKVEVGIIATSDSCEIYVKDNGCGIPQEVLPHIGERGMTYGKIGGNGLGIYHAKLTAEQAGGTLRVFSAIGEGTIVTLRIPQEKSNTTQAIVLSQDSVIAVLDDQELSHLCWRERFKEIEHIDVKHFYKPRELQEWCDKLNGEKAKVTFLCDYNLGENQKNGLEVIQSLGIASQAVLVTGLSSERKIQEECKRLNIPLLPKEQIASVSLQVR